jgi:hypothetical protein
MPELCRAKICVVKNVLNFINLKCDFFLKNATHTQREPRDMLWGRLSFLFLPTKIEAFRFFHSKFLACARLFSEAEAGQFPLLVLSLSLVISY